MKVVAGLVLLVLGAACSGPSAVPRTMVAPVGSVRFLCDNAETVEMQFLPDRTIARFDGGGGQGPIELAQQPAASGFHYTNGRITVRGKGDEIRVQVGAGAPLRCVETKPGAARFGASASQVSAPTEVVFVCEHGSVKSVIAAQWFTRLAAERGLPFRGVARGVAPDAAIPGPVAGRLEADGFSVMGYEPAALAAADLRGARAVVAIGANSPLFESLDAPPEHWDAIPPASVNYDASREAIRQQIELLLDRLEADRGGGS
jgi:arsenate reductase